MIDNDEFENWWREIGSTKQISEGNNAQEHAYEVAALAWETCQSMSDIDILEMKKAIFEMSGLINQQFDVLTRYCEKMGLVDE